VFSQSQNFGTSDVAEIAKKIISLPKENKARTRMVVFTQGNGDVIVATCKNQRKLNHTELLDQQLKFR